MHRPQPTHPHGETHPTTIVLFTDQFPYGKNEPFLETEIHHLHKQFDDVIILPRRSYKPAEKRPLPASIKTLSPLFENESRLDVLWRGIFSSSPFHPMLKDFWLKRVFLSPKRFWRWAEATLLVRAVLAHEQWKRIHDLPDDSTVLYFYWSCGTAWAHPFCNTRKASVARFHGYDVYENEQKNPNYIPFRESYLKSLSHPCTVSEQGRKYLQQRYPQVADKIKLFRLGVKDIVTPPFSAGPSLRIITCSRLIPLKRMGLLMDALQRSTIPIEWSHLGDGPLLESLRDQSQKLPSHVKANFLGAIPNQDVLDHYRHNPYDLFVNLSTTEGLPVAIMEALSAGIPVFATDVGGVSELIDNKVGELLDPDINARKLMDKLERFFYDTENRATYSQAARNRWDKMVNASKNYSAFTDFLSTITITT